MTLGLRIRKARTSKRYSQAQLAEKLGVGRSAVANWECGEKAPRTVHLQQLSMLTGVSFEWLATGRGKPALGEDWIPAAEAEVVDDPAEIHLLHVFRSCTAAARRAAIELILSKASSRKKSALPPATGVQSIGIRRIVRAAE